MFTRLFPPWSDEYTQFPFSCLSKIHFFHVYVIFFFFDIISFIVGFDWEIKKINSGFVRFFLNIYTRYSQVCFTQIYRPLYTSEGQYNYSSLEEIM